MGDMLFGFGLALLIMIIAISFVWGIGYVVFEENTKDNKKYKVAIVISILVFTIGLIIAGLLCGVKGINI